MALLVSRNSAAPSVCASRAGSASSNRALSFASAGLGVPSLEECRAAEEELDFHLVGDARGTQFLNCLEILVRSRTVSVLITYFTVLSDTNANRSIGWFVCLARKLAVQQCNVVLTTACFKDPCKVFPCFRMRDWI